MQHGDKTRSCDVFDVAYRQKIEGEGQRNAHEDILLCRLIKVPAEGVQVLLLAARDFGDAKLFHLLNNLGFEYIFKFKGNIFVKNTQGEKRKSSDWLPEGRCAIKMMDVSVTAKEFNLGAVVMTQAPDLKDAWYLACSARDISALVAIAHYGKRFSREENFRDVKDIKLGIGLSHFHIGRENRRDRLLLINVFSDAADAFGCRWRGRWHRQLF